MSPIVDICRVWETLTNTIHFSYQKMKQRSQAFEIDARQLLFLWLPTTTVLHVIPLDIVSTKDPADCCLLANHVTGCVFLV